MAIAAGITKVDDHSAESVDLLLEQFRQAERFHAWIKSYVDRVQIVEDVAWQLLVDRRVDTAAGVNLDVIGRIVGQARAELSDAEYRLAIKGRIRANVSDGTATDIYKTLVAILGDAVVARIDEQFPGALSLVVVTPLTYPAVVAAIVKDARAAGIRLDLEYSSFAEDETFTFASGDDDDESDDGRGFADDGETVGGHLAGVL